MSSTSHLSTIAVRPVVTDAPTPMGKTVGTEDDKCQHCCTKTLCTAGWTYACHKAITATVCLHTGPLGYLFACLGGHAVGYICGEAWAKEKD